MKRISFALSMLATAAVIGLTLPGCSSTTSTPAVTVVPASGLKAISADAGTIKVQWTRDASDVGTDTVMAVGGATPVMVTSTGTSATLSGLAAGVEYTITVSNAGGTSASLKWMTAVRTNNVRVYQFSSPSHPSGLSLSVSGAKAISVQTANKDSIDFILDDVLRDPTITNASGISFEGAQVFDATWLDSYIDTTSRYVVGGLDADFSSASFATQLSGAAGNAYDIPNDAGYTGKGSRVLLAVTHDGHLAKIEIVAQANGMLYSGVSPDKYVTLNVSYQPVAGKAYAARPHLRYGAHVPRVSVQ